LPLFAADTGGLWIDRSIVIAAGLLPVLVVLWTRRRSGGASTVPDWALNRSWRPPAEEGVEAPTAEPPPEEASPADEAARGRAGRPLPAAGVLGLGAAGLTGLAVWVSGIGTVDSPRLAVDRGQMEAEARSALEAQGISLGEEWTPLFSVASERPLAHWFVWEEGSEDDYRNLLGDFLNTPNWRVRFVSFEVPPEERAEAFTVGLYQTGRSPRVTHDLPEGRAGARLPEEEARILATEAVELQLGGDPERIREISADENVLPERTDWTFTFAATEGYPLAEGEGRFMVRIAGEEVVGVGRFVHIPEEWARTWQAEESKRALPSLVPIGLLIFLTIGAGVLAIVMWARGHLETRPLRLLSVPVAVLFLFTGINEWPNAVGVFSTTLSFGNQTAMVILGVGLGAMLLSAALSLLASLGHTWLREPRTRIFRPAVAGGALAMAFIGASQALSRLGPSQPPTWPDFSGAVTFVPWLAVGLGGLIQHLILTSVLLFLLGSLERIRSTGWTWAGIPLLLVLGFSLASYPPGTTWLFWTGGAIAVAAGIGIFWTICRRLGWAVLPGAAAAVVLLGLVETGLRNPFPGAVLGACLGAAAVVVATIRWTREL
ncbi:MAG: hypothetical protein KJN92_15415, partial [Gemmatimonadetes bacterium]|nr:hypothetical protein [Gemmatimonadota bacterium]